MANGRNKDLEAFEAKWGENSENAAAGRKLRQVSTPAGTRKPARSSGTSTAAASSDNSKAVAAFDAKWGGQSENATAGRKLRALEAPAITVKPQSAATKEDTAEKPQAAPGGQEDRGSIGRGVFGYLADQLEYNKRLKELQKQAEQLQNDPSASGQEKAAKDAEIDELLREWQQQLSSEGTWKNTAERLGEDLRGIGEQWLGSLRTFGQALADPDVQHDVGNDYLAAQYAQMATEAIMPKDRERLMAMMNEYLTDPDQSEPYTAENSPGVAMQQRGQQRIERALEGMEGPARFAANTANSMAENLPGMALGAVIPGVGTVAGLGVMGMQAAGGRMAELGAEDVNAGAAFERGLVSGGIEIATESIPVGNWAKIIRGNGKSAVRNILTQMGEEGTEEAVSYLANYAADLAAQDPNAHFSLAELLQSAGMGAASGAGFGALGTGLNAAGRAISARQAERQAQANANDAEASTVPAGTDAPGGATPAAQEQAAAAVTRAAAQMQRDAVESQTTEQREQAALALAAQQTAARAAFDPQGMARQIEAETDPRRATTVPAAVQAAQDASDAGSAGEAMYREYMARQAALENEAPSLRMETGEQVRELAAEQGNAYSETGSPYNGTAVQASPYVAEMRQAVAAAADADTHYTEKMRDVVKEGYNGQSPTVYMQAMNGMYDAGRTGSMTYEQAMAANRTAAMAVNDPALLYHAWALGQNSVKSENEAAPAIGAVEGSVRYEDGTAEGSTQLPAEVLNAAARKLGTNVRVVQTLTDGNGDEVNGHWAAGLAELAISEKSGNAYQTLVHETGEYIKTYNPEGWARLRSSMIGWYASARGMGAAQRTVFDRYENAYGDSALGADEAARDLFGGVFSTEEGTRSFLEYLDSDETMTAPEKRSVVQTLWDILDRLIESIRALLRGGDATIGAAEGRRLAEQAEQMENCRALMQDYLAELDTARQNAQAKSGEAQQQNTAASGMQAAASEIITEESSENTRQSRPVTEQDDTERRGQYPQAVYNGRNQYSYNTLISLPDIRMTKLVRNNVQGMTKDQIVEAGLDSTDRVPGKRYGWVKQRYTGTNIVVTAESLTHGLTGNRLSRNGPYVPQIGQILENAIKVNEINPKAVDESTKGTRQEKFRWDNVDHVDVYLGVAQYPKEAPYVIRFLVNVYKDGMHRLDDRDGYIVLKGSLYAHTGTKNDTTTDAFRRSGAGTLARAQGSDVINSEDNTIQGRNSDASTISASVPATITIADFLKIVNDLDNENIPGVLSKDVKDHIGSNAVGDFGEKVRYSRPVFDEDGQNADAGGESDSEAFEEDEDARAQLKEIEEELEQLEEEIWSGNSENAAAAMDRREELEARQQELERQIAREGEQRKRQSEARQVAWEISRMEEQLEALYKQRRKLGGRVITQNSVKNAVTRLLVKYESRYDKATMMREVKALFESIANTPDISVDEAMETCVNLMRDVLRQSVRTNTNGQEYYAPIKAQLRDTVIEVQQGSPIYHELLDAFGDGENGRRWGNVRRTVGNRLQLRLVQHAGNADTVFAELAEQYPATFDAEADIAENVQRAMTVFEAGKPVYENIYGMDLDAAAAVAGQELLAEYLHTPEWNSREEWQKREREKLEQEYRGRLRDALTDQRAGYEARLKAARQNRSERIASLQAKIRSAESENRVKDAQKYRRQLEKYRTDTDEKALRLQAIYDNREVRRMEDRRRSAARDAVDRQVKRLNRWLLAPTNQAYVQDKQKKALVDLLTAFDWNTSRPDNERATAQWRDVMGELATVAAQMDKNVPEGWDYVDFDPDLPDMIKALRESAGSKKAQDFNYLQMEMAKEILETVAHSITNANRLLVEGQRQSLTEAATSAIGEMEEVQNRQVRERDTAVGRLWNKVSDTKVVDELVGLTGVETMDAGRFFSRLGPTAQRLYQNLRDAFDRRVYKLQAMKDAWEKATRDMKVDEKTLAKWTGEKAEKHTFTLTSGTQIELTAGQVMELYCLTQREQAKLHLVQGGILFKDGARGGEKPTHLTATDIANMTGVLTPKQVKFCDWMQQYLSTDVATWGNEATMRQYGVRKFTEGHYWPISSEKNMQRLTDASAANGSVLRGMHPGFAERTVRYANTALYLHDAIDTFIGHGVAMATYSEMGLAQGDLLRWYNWKEADNSASVQRALEGVFGKKGKDYFVQFMKDVTGTQAQGSQQGFGFVRTLMRNWKVAKVAFNFRVAVQQPTAYLRAMAVLDPGSMMSGVSKLPFSFATHEMRRAKNLMRQYCGIAQWKDWGFFESNISTDLKTVITGQDTLYGKVQDASTGMAELGDRWTWEAIWLACEADVKKRQPKLKFGSEEFNRAVGKRMSEVVDKTQVVDSVFHRSQIVRSDNWLKQTATNFMNEPIKTWNMVRDAVVELAQAKGKEDVRAKQKQMARVMAVTAVTALATAFAAAAMDGARELNYDDDEEKEAYTRWQRYWRNFWEAAIGYSADNETWREHLDSFMASNLAGNLNMIENIPLVKDIFAMANGEDILRNDTESIKELFDAVTGITNYMKGKGTKSPYSIAYKAAAAASDLSGIAVGSLLREAKSLYDLTTDDPLGLNEPSNRLSSAIVHGNAKGANKLLAGLVNEKLQKDHTMLPGDAVSSVRTSITKMVKQRYLEADDAEQSELRDTLLKLVYTTADGEEIHAYEQTDLNEWLNDVDRPAWTAALARLDAETAQELTDTLMERKMDEGKTAKDAASDLRKTVTSTMKPLYIAGDDTTRRKIEDLLFSLEFDGQVIYDRKDLEKWLK